MSSSALSPSVQTLSVPVSDAPPVAASEPPASIPPPPAVYQPSTSQAAIRGLIKTIRPHQWVKNLFVAAPMFFHKDVFKKVEGVTMLDLDVTSRAAAATLVFCLLAGAVYTMNDLVDVEADRVHPVKRSRPIAAGIVPIPLAKVAAAGLVLVSLAMACAIDWRFAGVSLFYFIENVAYSFKLKKVAFLDVGLIALGFVLRVIGGGYATHTDVSKYMLVCTLLLALFLGFGKRRQELNAVKAGKTREALESYTSRSLNIALLITGVATVGAYIAYTVAPSTEIFFQTKYLWLTAPFTVFGLGRFLMIVSGRTGRGKKSESPTQEMLSDVPFVLNLVAWVVVVVAVVYQLRPG